jgi:hypothetical protein
LPDEIEDIRVFYNHYTSFDGDIYRTIHGSHHITGGYGLVFVPVDAEFSSEKKSSLPCGYSAVKILVALGQLLYAASTLYWSKGDQITQYGYAAFGLTVAPYAVMSVVNLLGNLITPQYPAVYLVRSSVMTEAELYGGCSFDGVVGTLEEGSTAELENENEHFRLPKLLKFEDSKRAGQLQVSFQELTTKSLEPSSKNDGSVASDRNAVQLTSQDERRTLLIREDRQSGQKARSILYIPSEPFLSGSGQAKSKIHIQSEEKGKEDDVWMSRRDSEEDNTNMTFLLSIPVIAIQIAIIGGLSRFQSGASTRAQRVWTMTWFSFGILIGYLQFLTRESADEWRALCLTPEVFWILLVSAPAIGGFVVVGQMLTAFGDCVRFS